MISLIARCVVGLVFPIHIPCVTLLRRRNPGFATAVLKRLARDHLGVATVESVRHVLDFMMEQKVEARISDVFSTWDILGRQMQ